MTEEIEQKLRTIYNNILGKAIEIVTIFEEQFGEEYVDVKFLHTFDEWVEGLNKNTLGYFISDFNGSNQYGNYSIDREDYDKNGRGKPFLEYIPDLGLLDFLYPAFEQMLKSRDPEILIHFPTVRVTNEHDKYIDIYDLYAHVQFNYEGKLTDGFKLLKATYTYDQLMSGYSHSHLPSVYNASSIREWRYPCLGNGPIERTQERLYRNYNKDVWGLFAYELSKYVTVESLTGGPYIRLENIGKNSNQLYSSNYHFGTLDDYELRGYDNIRHMLKLFINYYIEHNDIKLNYVNGHYCLGEDVFTFVIKLSNALINYINDNPDKLVNIPQYTALKDKVFQEVTIRNEMFYAEGGNGRFTERDIQNMEQITLFSFKGKPVHIKVIRNAVSSNNTVLIIREYVYEIIMTAILTSINYKYGQINKRGNTQEIEIGEKCYII